jgi:hypothetical protein
VGICFLLSASFGLKRGNAEDWRKNLRPVMIAHAWSDIFGVAIFRGM